MVCAGGGLEESTARALSAREGRETQRQDHPHGNLNSPSQLDFQIVCFPGFEANVFKKLQPFVLPETQSNAT